MIKGRHSLHQIPASTPFKPAAQIMREMGFTELLRMGANENPLGPSPKAVQAMASALSQTHCYPDAGNLELRAQLAQHLGFGQDHIVVEAGITGLLRVAVEAFIEPGQRVVFPWPTFAIYSALTRSLGGVAVHVPLLPDLQVDWDALARAADGARMVWICNPNNPTGISFGLKPLRRSLEVLPPDCLLVIDEAYYEFSDGETALPLVREGHPVVVMRTFSKAHGIAGLRVGYAIARPNIADWFHRCREPFQVSSVSQAAALGALADQEHLIRSVATVREGRAFLAERCRRLGIDVVPSDANFVLLRFGFDCRPLEAALLRHGIMVRATDLLFDLSGGLRVTVGTPEMNRRFVELLPTALTEVGRGEAR